MCTYYILQNGRINFFFEYVFLYDENARHGVINVRVYVRICVCLNIVQRLMVMIALRGSFSYAQFCHKGKRFMFYI